MKCRDIPVYLDALMKKKRQPFDFDFGHFVVDPKEPDGSPYAKKGL
jgi:hypothetical protein